MARKIIIKTVSGREYRYERIETKRVGGKVTTKDKYLGPVVVARRGKIEQASEKAQQNLKALYQIGYPLADLVRILRDQGTTVGESTIRNYMRREGISRMPHTGETRSEIAKGSWEKKRQEKARKQRGAREDMKMLLDDGAIKTTDALAMMTGDVDEGIVKLLWGKEKKKRAAKRKRKS